MNMWQIAIGWIFHIGSCAHEQFYPMLPKLFALPRYFGC